MTSSPVSDARGSTWDPRFWQSSPAFETFDRETLITLESYQTFPSVATYHLLKSDSKLGCTFCTQDSEAVRKLGGYDAFIAATRQIPTCPNSFHDLMNALVWLHFPELKTALHRRLAQIPGGKRGGFQNAAAHFDESGMVILSSDASIFDGLSALRWEEIFWTRRAHTQSTTRFLTFGHGLLDALRQPFIGLTGKALFVCAPAELIAAPSANVRSFAESELCARFEQLLETPRSLEPVPVLGIPGWHVGQTQDFYRNTHYFRTERRSRPEDLDR